MFGRKKMNAQMLTDITRGIHHAVNTTGSMIAQQYIMMFQQFFDTDPDDGSISAKMVKVQVDEKHEMLVPLIAMVNPQGIALEKMRFELSIQVTESELKKATHEVDNLNASRTSFKVYLAPKSSDSIRRHTDIVDVEMAFTRCRPPEGIARLIEHYTNMIQPYERPKDAEPPPEPELSGDESGPSPEGPMFAAAPRFHEKADDEKAVEEHEATGTAPPSKSEKLKQYVRAQRKLNIVKMNTKATGDMKDDEN